MRYKVKNETHQDELREKHVVSGALQHESLVAPYASDEHLVGKPDKVNRSE